MRVKFRTKKMAIWLFIILNSNTNFGQAGAALAFDGVNDIISAGNAITTILNDTNKLTVEAWVNASNTTGIKTIVCNHQGEGFAQFDLRIINNTFDCFVGFGTYIVRAGTVIPNTWQHVAMVFDGATLVLYVNGAIAGTTNTPSYILPNGNATVTMGNNGYAEIFQGRLDEVRIWNRALTQCEIQNNRNAELPAGQTSLLGYYKFNQGTSAGNNTGNIILTDTSGNNNIGFLTNFDLIGTTSNWIAPGGVVTGTNATVFQNLSASAAITNVTCNGGTNGSATVTATGGFGGYTYLWAPSGGTSATATNLSAGNYTCTITSSGCTFTSNVTITQPVTITSAPTALTTQIYAGSGTIANLTATGSSIQWYYTATGGTVLPTTTSLVNGAIYYASQTILGCESPTRVAVTVKKISEATQTFCAAARVVNLVSTPNAGATASWFTAPSGGAAMVTSATLSTGTYYVEQSSPLTITTLSTAFSSLSGVAVQADGKIVVADAGDGAVVRINADGTGNIPLANIFSGPRSVAVQADGKIVLTDTGNNFIKRMNANGTGIVTLGTGFSSPRGVAVQADGKILVADTNNSVIKRMNEDGTGIVTLGTGFSRPNGVAVQADGKILVADSNNFVIKRMNADGTGIVVVGPSFVFPMGVSLQADGKIVVADAGSTAIKRMNADGTGIVSIGFGFSNPAGVAVQADGKILAVDTSSALKRITEAVFSNRVPVNVVVAAPVSGTTIVTNTSCFGSSNGAINLAPTGGTAPYTFNWGGGITTEDRTGLAAGTYSVIITDANGCTGTVSGIVVTQPTAISGSTVVTNVACNSGSNGAINLTPSGGTAPYTFNWGGGITTEDRTGLAPGTYSVIITDANSCTVTVSGIVVAQPTAITTSASQVNVACFGGTNGSATVSPSGGTPGYTYAWSNGSNTNTASGLNAGTHVVTVTDANGCTATRSFTLTQPASAVSGTTVVTNTSCFGGNNGAINLTPAGGTAPYTFNWGGGITTEDRAGLAAGTYSVTITDSNGCTSTVSGITVTQPPSALSGTTVVTNISCFGGSNGAINLTPTGGTSSYTYFWGGGITTEDRTGLIAGGYNVRITDANGCTADIIINISQATQSLSGTVVITNVTCFASANGTINLTPTGGTAPYTFNWGGGITTEDRTGLVAGTYSVIITDANGCTTNTNATVAEPAAINNSVTQASGVLTATQNGATYQWFQCPSTLISGETNQSFTPTIVGDYKVNITLSDCTVTSNCVTVTTLGNQNFEFTSNISVYPNPSRDVFLINSDTLGTVVVYDVIGKIIKTENLDLGITKLDLSNYPSAIYLMKVTNDSNQTKTMKLKKL